MDNNTLYIINIVVSIIVYLIVFCSLNKYNCTRNNGLYLPIRTFVTPFREFISGNFVLFLQMILSIDTPYLFIIIAVILTAIYIKYIKKNKKQVNDNKVKVI